MKRNASRILLAALVVMLCVGVAVSHPQTQKSTAPAASHRRQQPGGHQ